MKKNWRIRSQHSPKEKNKTESKKTVEQYKLNSDCPQCKRRSLIEKKSKILLWKKRFCCEKPKHQIDEELRWQNRKFPERLSYANKKIKKTFNSMMIKRCESKEEVHNIVQKVKGKTKVKLHQDLSSYYDEMCFVILKFKQHGDF